MAATAGTHLVLGIAVEDGGASDGVGPQAPADLDHGGLLVTGAHEEVLAAGGSIHGEERSGPKGGPKGEPTEATEATEATGSTGSTGSRPGTRARTRRRTRRGEPGPSFKRRVQFGGDIGPAR
jgi:hypothetical protein